MQKIIMARQLFFDDIVTSASQGGYVATLRLSSLTSVFLLSACWVLRDRQLWQNSIDPITNGEYDNIISMIQDAEYELMNDIALGAIFASIADLSAYDNVLLLDGQTIAQADYPTLTAVVPASWLVATDIILPSMNNAGLFGKNASASNLGAFRGQNTVSLTESEMPSHNHDQVAHGHSTVIPVVIPTGAGPIVAGASVVTPTPSVTGLFKASNIAAGGGGAHENVQRSLNIFWYIVVR